MTDVDGPQSILNPHTRTRRGLCPVSRIHGQCKPHESHSLYFEVHGSGPQKIVLIMGLNATSSAWLYQVDHFGKLEQYSTLVFDNRGIGMSGSPWGLYSTTEMAEDVLCLLDHLQWTKEHSLHVVGISLGGMIAQELAYRIPGRIISLSLVVTRATSTLANLPPLSICLHLIELYLTTSDLDRKVAIAEGALFPTEWLDSLAEDDPQGRTNREVHRNSYCRRVEIVRRPTISGALGQLAACLTHEVTSERLAKVSASVPKVLILNAIEDMLIPHTEGERLKRHMPEAEYQCWKRTGHAICVQHKARFNQLLEKVFEEGKAATRKGAAAPLESKRGLITCM